MKKLITFIFGTRPELIKLAPLINAAKNSFDVRVVSTGQHKELINNLYEWFDIKVDFNLDVMQANQSPGQVIASILNATEEPLKNSDFVVVQGDTASAFAGAMSAFLQKIPVIHLEAGLRTDDVYNPFPEEMLRRQISQLTTIHLPPTELAANNLKREGFAENIHIVGNTVIDSLKNTIERLNKLEKEDLKNLRKHLTLPEIDLENKKLILVTMHRRENLGEEHSNVAKALARIADEFADSLIIFPIHPNPSVRKAVEPYLKGKKNVLLIEPVDYVSFSWLMMKSYILVTDSGGLQEEGCFLGKPTLVLRKTTERPEAVNAGVAELIGTEEDVVYLKTRELLSDLAAYKKMAKASSAFGDGNSSGKVLGIISGFKN
ncbi:MAG: UDP-N-acetylglucosamine 2-epimerase (non-hydrolyzing) [Candidatus Caenarcaniphilales bacterium]|nr:UDP-N-acetylglucosamine 2-epimerase (non-hydrolyzing) [Candidatus Caenarcaniphilales bacterium]